MDYLIWLGRIVLELFLGWVLFVMGFLGMGFKIFLGWVCLFRFKVYFYFYMVRLNRGNGKEGKMILKFGNLGGILIYV